MDTRWADAILEFVDAINNAVDKATANMTTTVTKQELARELRKIAAELDEKPSPKVQTKKR